MKFRSIFFSVIGLLGLSLPVQAQTDLDSQIQQVLNQHYQTYRDREYFSAIQSSIHIGDQPVRILHRRPSLTSRKSRKS